MQPMIIKHLLNTCLAVLHVAVTTAMVVSVPVSAQSIDADPPVVDFQPVPQGVRGDSQVISATVTDNIAVETVLLHYRWNGDSLYQVRDMQTLGTTDIYTAIIDTESESESITLIQYYIEASDAAGNRTLEGFAFDPIERNLVDQQLAPDESAPEDEIAPLAGISTGRTILYGVLGLIVLGTLASSSSGGGSGSAEPGVEVTVVVDELP